MLRPLFRAQVAVCAYWLLSPLAGCVREHTLFEAASAGQGGGDTSAAGLSAGAAGLSAGAAGLSAGAAGSSVGAAGLSAAGGMGGMGGTGDGFGGTSSGATSGVAGASGTAGNAGALSLPWTESSCTNALSLGKSGDACLEVFKCATSADCCSISAYCNGSTLDLQSNCTLCPVKCSADADCGAKSLCESYQCRSCPPGPCPKNWSEVLRNGCAVCVPPSQCKEAGDPVCGALSCAPGLSCLPGCKADPSCCFGNQCVDPSCPILKELDCLVVGCYPGSFCKEDGPAIDCKCQPSTGTFSCSGTSHNVCNAY